MKLSLFSAVRDYVRTNLLKQHREVFNEKFRKEPEATRTPLNVADYARVPLLNPDQKVKDWREKLPALENEYDSRMISLGQSRPGVYLIEAVNEGMRSLFDRHRHQPDDDREDQPARPGSRLCRRSQNGRAARRRFR